MAVVHCTLYMYISTWFLITITHNSLPVPRNIMRLKIPTWNGISDIFPLFYFVCDKWEPFMYNIFQSSKSSCKILKYIYAIIVRRYIKMKFQDIKYGGPPALIILKLPDNICFQFEEAINCVNGSKVKFEAWTHIFTRLNSW